MNDHPMLQTRSILSFQVGQELFAAPVEQVISILDVCKVTRVPRSPVFLMGITNLRGSVLPVIDSRIRFGLEVTAETRTTGIIVMEVMLDHQPMTLGLWVDAIHEVLEVDHGQILPPPGLGNKYRAEFISGILNIDGQFIMLLDVNALFTSDELLLVSESTGDTGHSSEKEAI
jgi:purine-binding chemotaxis protein CheW